MICIVTLDLDTNLLEALKPELKNQVPRSSTKLEKIGKKIKITIRAENATALRASFNSITRLIAVYEAVKNGR